MSVMGDTWQSGGTPVRGDVPNSWIFPNGIGNEDHAQLINRDAASQHPQSAITGLTSALDLKAPLDSPNLSGTPTAPTARAGTNTTQIATTGFVQTAVSGVVAARTATLTTAGWTGSAAPWTQTVNIANNGAGMVGLAAGATQAQFEAEQTAGLWVYSRTATTITVAAGNEKPTIAIPIEYVGA